ncbi:4Fe-4S dicluster domain-containing protein [Anthocerotibacter panamensis]|uniref:4Fe-4S dicluster domain-containing protein n=1 Tax=Anthocerotibacter panamensis TaxID=2857077 RepID=UPI001C408178|nr:4Fe-4S dicluster domain-containing protein [Anthocerotibacter panamensis]
MPSAKTSVDSSNPDAIHYDLLLVGGSSSNLVLAHRLLDLAKLSGLTVSIAIVEKGPQFGAHIVSGAISDPHVIAKLFPDYRENGFPIEGFVAKSHLSVLGEAQKWDLPEAMIPEGLQKDGHAILTLSHVIRWLADQLQEKAKDLPNVTLDLFPGFAAQEILYEGETVVGVRVSESGSLTEDAIFARCTCFGDKGFISKDLIAKFNLRPNPQLWSVGVKEVWEIEGDYQGQVWHTLGYPVLDGTFGGGFVYGLSAKRLAIGLIISLDSHNPNINPQQRLQDYKAHPWIQGLLKGGRLLKYGAAVIPEGGYYSLPTRFMVNGALLLGDALGVLDAASLSGVDRAMETGYIAAGLLHDAFLQNDFGLLDAYQQQVLDSFVGRALYTSRYFRNAFLSNGRLLGEYLPAVAASVDERHPWFGSLRYGLAKPIQRATETVVALTQILGKTQRTEPAVYTPCHEQIQPDFSPRPVVVNAHAFTQTLYPRSDAVFFAGTKYHEGNRHIEEFSAETCQRCIATYEKLGKATPCVSDCTAEVHRVDVLRDLHVHAMSLENCIQCRTCEIVCPKMNLRVNPTYEGSGPDFYGL